MTESSESPKLALEASESETGHPEWRNSVAFTTLVIAVLAATAALLAGVTSHEILIERTEEIVDVAIAQGDLERAETIRSMNALLAALGVEPDPLEIARADELAAEAKRELDKAAEADSEVFAVGAAHLVFALSATVFAVAIAIAGLSVIVGRRWLWVGGILIAALGLVALVVGLIGFYT